MFELLAVLLLLGVSYGAGFLCGWKQGFLDGKEEKENDHARVGIHS